YASAVTVARGVGRGDNVWIRVAAEIADADHEPAERRLDRRVKVPSPFRRFRWTPARCASGRRRGGHEIGCAIAVHIRGPDAEVRRGSRATRTPGAGGPAWATIAQSPKTSVPHPHRIATMIRERSCCIEI